MSSDPKEPKLHVCTLAYKEDESYGSAEASGTVFLVAKWEAPERLTLFFNPAWRDFVSTKHREYTEDLLEDLRMRKNFEPEGLFQQLCSLEVGPIVTHKDRPDGDYIPTGFVELL